MVAPAILWSPLSTTGKKLFLIGHLDTVFEPDMPANPFTMLNDSTATGQGVNDMKGGDVVMIIALQALHAQGLLKDADIIAYLTGDEEHAANPREISRADFIESAKKTDIALAFEGANGLNSVATARRGASGWTLNVKAKTGHSSGVFTPNAGYGAIYEAARIVNEFRVQLSTEKYLTFNPGVFIGGSEMNYNSAKSTGTAIGKTNIISPAVTVTGDLRFLTEENKWTRVLVFVATKYATEHVADKLRRAGLDATALHGELSQGARTQALADFKAGRVRLLIATDLAARGLDIEELPVVVNYDLPRSAVDYVHRIGRTGRAGARGVAVSFVSAETHAHFHLIEKRNARGILREQIDGFEPVEIAPPVPVVPGGGGVKGKRKSKKDKLREAAGLALPVNLGTKSVISTEPVFKESEPKEFFPWAQRVMVGRRMR
jgi:acetylornithine deacetylase/succinyl-diaminopimelate desuccinylase-like protein